MHDRLWSENDWKGVKLGRYRILELLSEEDASRTFLADDEILIRKVAFKTVSETLQHDGESQHLKNFLREVQAAAVLQHPNIVCIYDVIHEEGVVAVAKEYFEGRTVEDLIFAREELSFSRICTIIADAAAGLAFAHETGMVHQDIKPASLILNSKGTCKVLDFGAAAMQKDGDAPTRREKIDSPFFTSPEVIRGKKAEPASDVYALGVILWWLISGVPPFVAKTKKHMYRKHLEAPVPDIANTRPGIPPALVALINGCLVKDPAKRTADCGKLSEQLRSIAGDMEHYERSDLAKISAVVGAPKSAPVPAIKPRTGRPEPEQEDAGPGKSVQQRKKIVLIGILSGALLLVISAVVLTAVIGSSDAPGIDSQTAVEDRNGGPRQDDTRDAASAPPARYMRSTDYSIDEDFFTPAAAPTNPEKPPEKQPVSTGTVASSGGGKGPFIEKNGTVVIPAADFDRSTPAGGMEWKVFRGRDARTHTVRVPDKGRTKHRSLIDHSPRLDYRVQFSTGGTYIVWVQGHGDKNGDSVHIGIDERLVAARMTVGRQRSWSRTNMERKTGKIPGITPGVHTINLWMREDGCSVCKILLTTDPKFKPAGTRNKLSARAAASK